MSLLAGLLDRVKVVPAQVVAPLMVKDANIALVVPPASEPEQQRSYLTAATATSEWIAVRDQYINHLMAYRACYAPTARYCVTGDELRQRYDRTSLEIKP